LSAQTAILKTVLRQHATSVIGWVVPGRKADVAHKLLNSGRVRAQAIAGRRHIVAGTAVVWPRSGCATAEPLELVEPGPGQILVRTECTLVSPGTERAMFCGLPNTRVDYPAAPGYSGAGVVVAVGSRSSQYEIGTRVAGPLPHASLAILDETEAFAIPDAVPFEMAAFIHLAVIALQAVRQVQPLLRQSVSVLGQGLVGQLATQFAHLSGAYPVVALARSPQKLDLSLRSGATRVIALQDEPTAPEQLGADVAIEATGNPGAVLDALRCVRPGGRVILLGSPRGVTHNVDFGHLVVEKRIRLSGAHITALPQSDSSGGGWTYRREAQAFLALLAGGRMHLNHLISERVNPMEAGWFYQRLAHWEDGMVSVLFDWTQLPDRRRWHRMFFLAWPQQLIVREPLFLPPADPRPGHGGRPLDDG
jgi:threonine dehydrogenase-like Zn-dependent dehydrogenase